MHNQNNGSIVFKLCISIVWVGGDVYVAVCSEFIAEGGCPRPHHARGRSTPSPATPGAAENLSTSLFVRESFCSRVIHFSLGIPSRTSGVL